MNKRFTNKDFILVLLILVVAALCYLVNIFSDKDTEKTIVIRVDGKIEKTCSLDQNITIEINGGTNKLKITDGKAYMIEADCPDHICISQGEISRNKESIICLPNKVVVEVEIMNQSDAFDVVAK